ncbi:GNAT family N-acetyltransferase [Leptolyngbya ohadii]|uniref:GNAT family N-acetyltransferase n=1 Tax=Leptolyngbya ohadii TaxID=1962290 RepID=UPI000B598CCE|nr:N-acetyltransferase [Leptolyngbya ohadii]
MVQQSEEISYRAMSLVEHDPEEVARLIYESAQELFDLIYGWNTIAYLTHLIQRSHNRFSHQYIRVAEIDRRIVGVITLVPATVLNDRTDFDQIFSSSQKLWLNLVQALLLRHLIRHHYSAGSLYIGNFAVAAEYRNRGIGRQLLSRCIDTAKEQSADLFITVDVNNARAQKLYESVGFQVVETKTIGLLGIAIGSRGLSIPNHSH